VDNVDSTGKQIVLSQVTMAVGLDLGWTIRAQGVEFKTRLEKMAFNLG
jgi:hypothetical protein